MGRRTASGLVFSRGGSSLAFIEPNMENRSIKCCNRLGCSTRLYLIKDTQPDDLERAKCSRTCCSVRSKTSTGSCSKSLPVSGFKKFHEERRSGKSLQEIESTTLSSRACKQVSRLSGSGNQETSSSSSSKRFATSRQANQAAKQASKGLAAGPQKHGLKNHSCAPPSHVLLSGGSSSNSGLNRSVTRIKKASSTAESSARGQNMTASFSGANLDSPDQSSSGPSVPGILVPEQASRTRARPTNLNAVSVRTRRILSGETTMRLSGQGDEASSASEPTTSTRLPQSHVSVRESSSRRSSRSSIEWLLRSSSGSDYRRPISYSEESTSQTLHAPLRYRDGHHNFNTEEIAEVLLALERIEHDRELLSYEQLLVLGTNLFLDGLHSHDQHRDMRMDIDNMSYEDLLALEEKMGTVSTALSEEALSRCLRRSNFVPASLVPGTTECRNEDIKCSICQDEYVLGDEVGNLACEHRYHVTCICQWLRQEKNWCPICKVSALPISCDSSKLTH